MTVDQFLNQQLTVKMLTIALPNPAAKLLDRQWLVVVLLKLMLAEEQERE